MRNSCVGGRMLSMAKLILTAENFAFGPIAKLLFVADLLSKKGYCMEFAGFGTSLQLAKHFPFDKIYEVDTDDPSSKKQLEQIIGKADMLISSMDLPSVVIAKNLKVPVVWIDCLFWFWESIFEPVLDVDLYVREVSMEDSANQTKYGSKIKNLFNVGPILSKIEKANRTNNALITFGGGEASHWYKVGRDTNYPFLMTNILNSYVDWNGFDRVIVATGEHIVKQLKKKYKDSRFEFECLPQDGFLQELVRCEILLTTAGLVTTESAFQYETPTIFLPSSNNSHYILLDELRGLGLAPASVELSDYMPMLNLRGKEEKESIAEVLEQLRQLENSQSTQKKAGRKINSFVQKRKSWSSRFVRAGKEFIDSLGGNGAVSVANEIDKMISEKGL